MRDGCRARKFEKEGSEESLRMNMGKPARRGHPDDLKRASYSGSRYRNLKGERILV